jgi:hypothetical protein
MLASGVGTAHAPLNLCMEVQVMAEENAETNAMTKAEASAMVNEEAGVGLARERAGQALLCARYVLVAKGNEYL